MHSSTQKQSELFSNKIFHISTKSTLKYHLTLTPDRDPTIPSHVHSLSYVMTHVSIRTDDLLVDWCKSILDQNVQLRYGHDVVHCTIVATPDELKEIIVLLRRVHCSAHFFTDRM